MSVYCTIPNSVTSIGVGAFAGCQNLTSVTISNSVTEIHRYVFMNCQRLISVTIPDGVERIYYETFSDCSNLISITIPHSVEFVENEAFQNCNSLKHIYLQREQPPAIERRTFKGFNINDCELHVPIGCKSEYEKAEGWKNFKNIVEDNDKSTKFVEDWEGTMGLPDFLFSNDDDFHSLTENVIDIEKQDEINSVFRDEVDNMVKTINEEFDRLKEKCIAGFYTFRGLLDIISESKGRKFVSENFDAIELAWKKSKAPKISQASYDILKDSFLPF